MRTDREAANARIDRGTVRRVLTFAGPHKRTIAVFLGVTVLDAALVVVTPLLVQRIVDDGIAKGVRRGLGLLRLNRPRTLDR
jgi:ATP-binding cassette subfamily B protein